MFYTYIIINIKKTIIRKGIYCIEILIFFLIYSQFPFLEKSCIKYLIRKISIFLFIISILNDQLMVV